MEWADEGGSDAAEGVGDEQKAVVGELEEVIVIEAGAVAEDGDLGGEDDGDADEAEEEPESVLGGPARGGGGGGEGRG